jgi:hypothetical protein
LFSNLNVAASFFVELKDDAQPKFTNVPETYPERKNYPFLPLKIPVSSGGTLPLRQEIVVGEMFNIRRGII